MSNPKRWFILSVVVGITLFVAVNSYAYSYRRCRGRNVVRGNVQTLQANQFDFPAGSAWRASLQSAVDAWNTAPATNFRYGLVFNAFADDDLGDGRNSVVHVPNLNNAAMVTRSRLSTCLWPFWRQEIRETDILVNTNPNIIWNTDTNPVPNSFGNSSTLDFVHELGHAFGLQHELNSMATMNPSPPVGGPIGALNEAHPHADDVLGNRAGYGTNGTADDLYASTYFRDSPGHSRTIDTTSTVSRGNPSNFLFTVGNRGTSNRTVQVSFFLSTDTNITTGDIQVGSTTLTLNAGVTQTLNAAVTVPLSVTPGFYTFGYIIDPTNVIAETNEGNNSVGHVDRTRVTSVSPPNACFTVTPTFGNAPLLVNLDASCSTDADGSIVDYSWTLGDGGLSFGPAPSYRYYSTGGFTIILTVTDNDGQTDTASSFVFVTCEDLISCPF